MTPRMKVKVPKRIYSLNVGAGFDMPTGEWVKGPRGDYLLNGGVANFSVTVGPGNIGKSLILHYWQAKIMHRMSTVSEPLGYIYDSENNINPNRVNKLCRNADSGISEDYIEVDDPETSKILYTDKSEIYPDYWWSDFKKYLKEVSKSKDMKFTGFSNSNRTVSAKVPLTVIIDSWSKFDPKAVDDMMDKSKYEDGSTNTIFMKSGAFKTKVLGQIPTVAPKPNVYFLTTAHVGKASEMGESKYSKPMKKLHDLKDGEVLKKVTEEFYYLTKVMWKAVGKRILKDSDKQPYYRVNKDTTQPEKDLYVIKLETLRNKHGGTGITIDVVISQEDGVLEDITAIYNLKNHSYGLIGNDTTFGVVFMPDVKVNRKSARPTLKKNKKFARAVQIAYDLYQLKVFHSFFVRTGIYVEPDELYKGIVERGYNWDELLTTRNWWSPDQYNELPENSKLGYCLTIVDLLHMYHGRYEPWWLSKKKKK